MNLSRLLFSLLALFFALNLASANEARKPVRILLMGDSTTEGGKPLFGESIKEILAAQADMPPVEVINAGKGGETAFSLLDSGRYDKEIRGLKDINYIFFRYGINDWFHRKPVEAHFRTDVKNVIARLREDFPGAKIVLMTIIPFLDEAQSKVINDFVYEVGKEEGLQVFDIYPLYSKKLQELGKHAMTDRFCPLCEVPARYHTLLKPYTRYYAWKKTDMVRVKTTEFDAIMGNLRSWYKDPHPNTTGYLFLADETARFLEPKLKTK